MLQQELAYSIANRVMKEIQWDWDKETPSFIQQLHSEGKMKQALRVLNREFKVRSREFLEVKPGLYNMSLKYIHRNRRKLKMLKTESFKEKMYWVQSKQIASQSYVNLSVLRTAMTILRVSTANSVSSTYEQSEACT